MDSNSNSDLETEIGSVDAKETEDASCYEKLCQAMWVRFSTDIGQFLDHMNKVQEDQIKFYVETNKDHVVEIKRAQTAFFEALAKDNLTFKEYMEEKIKISQQEMFKKYISPVLDEMESQYLELKKVVLSVDGNSLRQFSMLKSDLRTDLREILREYTTKKKSEEIELIKAQYADLKKTVLNLTRDVRIRRKDLRALAFVKKNAVNEENVDSSKLSDAENPTDHPAFWLNESAAMSEIQQVMLQLQRQVCLVRQDVMALARTVKNATKKKDFWTNEDVEGYEKMLDRVEENLNKLK